MTRFAILFALLAACGSSQPKDADPFDTYEACYTDHHVTESFDAMTAIAVCCTDHPIGGVAANVVCGASEQTCETYVTANLMAGDATATEITDGCNLYIKNR
jgi:hypothetical protein